MSIIFRARAYMHDTNMQRTKLATFHYMLGDLLGLSLSPAQFATLQLQFLQQIHATLGFAIRGVMSPQQGIMRWSSRYWEDHDTVTVPSSYVVYNVPPADCYGVYDKPSIDNQGVFPMCNFTTRFSSVSGTFGEFPVRSGHVKIMTAPEAVGELPPIFTAHAELSAIGTAISAPFDIDAIPGISFPITTATPVVPKLSYADELLSPDPDATANDYLAGYAVLTSADFSLRPRIDKNSTKPLYGL